MTAPLITHNIIDIALKRWMPKSLAVAANVSSSPFGTSAEQHNSCYAELASLKGKLKTPASRGMLTNKD